MELLIPGIILVAIMVWASTRIKKTAAEAFAAEPIDNADFALNKPEGMLTVLNGDPNLAFESYSKEYAGETSIRRVTADVRIMNGTSVEAEAAKLKDGTREISADIPEVIGERHYRLIEGTRTQADTSVTDRFKLGESGGRTFIFRVTSAGGTTAELENDIEAMLNSFVIK